MDVEDQEARASSIVSEMSGDDFENDTIEEIGEDVGAWSLLKRKRVFFAAVSQVMNLFIFSFPDPILAPHIKDVYKKNTIIVGILFALPTISYALTGPFVL